MAKTMTDKAAASIPWGHVVVFAGITAFVASAGTGLGLACLIGLVATYCIDHFWKKQTK